MNFEKPTKAFCMLAKAQKGNDSLNQLKKRDEQEVIVDYIMMINITLIYVITLRTFIAKFWKKV